MRNKIEYCKHEHISSYSFGGSIVYVCDDCGERLTKEERDKIVNSDISSPSYYTAGKIETWDFIIDKHLDFLEGNIVKYVVRWRQKNGVEDLKKAAVYLNKLIQEADKK